jgi:hypothetical protein
LRLWTRFIRWIGFQGCIQFNLDQVLTEWYSLLVRQFFLLCNGIFWAIWVGHNKLIFEGKVPDD